MNERCDVLVVGAGPVGLATAIGIAERGGSVLVLDKGSPPLDKACGEGIMPAGVELLHALGVDVPVAGCAPFRGIRFVHGDAHVEGSFETGYGLGIRRTVLSSAMGERARRLGVRFAYGQRFLAWQEGTSSGRATTTMGDVETGWLVGADGLHSTVRQRAGLAARSRGPRRYGMRRHYRVRPWSACVEVHWSEVAEAYVTPIGRDEVGVALLSSGDGERFDALLATFPALCRRLAGAPAASAVRGAGPLRQRVRRRHAGRIVLVGDAAGYVDPLTGEGITLGLRSAQALVETLTADRPLAAYERRYRRLSRDFYLLTGTLLAATRIAPVRRRLVPCLAAHAELFARLVQINAGQRPIRSVGLTGVWQLVAGLATAGT